MASSGKLARAFAEALGLPEAVASTVMKALRSEKDMVSMRGRGTSAADMTKNDAAVFLTAIASGAATSQIGAVTRMLLSMPQVYESPEGELPKGFKAVRRLPSTFMDSACCGNLLNALLAILDEAWNADEDDENDPRRPRFDVLANPDSLSFSIGMNGVKTGGYAIIRARVAPKYTVTRIYSTWGLIKVSDQDERFKELDPLVMFDPKVTFLSCVLLNGEVVGAAVQSLREEISRSRLRSRRISRVGRR